MYVPRRLDGEIYLHNELSWIPCVIKSTGSIFSQFRMRCSEFAHTSVKPVVFVTLAALVLAGLSCRLPQLLTPPPASATPPAAENQAPLAEFDQAQAVLPQAAAHLPELSGLPEYRLRARIDPPQRSFTGAVQITYTNLETTALDRLYLRLYPNGGGPYGNGALSLADLRLDGAAITPVYLPDDSIVEIPLPEPLPPGGTTILQAGFTGQVPLDFGGRDTQAYGLYNFTENVLTLSGWFPLLAVHDADGWNLDPVSPIGDSVYSDMAFFSVELELPQEWVLAATGQELSRQEIGSAARYQFASGPVRDFFLAASPDFELVTRDVGGVQVNSYYLPGSQPGGEQALRVAVDSLEAFNDRFGEYVYRQLDIVQAPMRNAGGVEFPGIVLIEANRYADPADPIFRVTVAHEVAHQWWYNLVGNDIIDEPWLDEAMATFSSALYYETVAGAPAYQAVLDSFNERYQRAGGDAIISQINQGMEHYNQPEFSRDYGAVVYMKGALFLDALRQEIGDEAFFAALQSYYSDYLYQIAAPQDFLEAFTRSAGRSLDDFYARWLSQP